MRNLPHRKAILEVRQKLEEIYKKKTQVQDMLDDAEESFDKLVSEDAKLSESRKISKKLFLKLRVIIEALSL